VGVIPWSPLAGGRLVRDWGVRGTARSELNERESSPNDPGDKSIVEAVAKIAGDRGAPRAGIALAWMLSKPYVHSPIIGATKPEQFTEALSSVDVSLDDHEIEELEAAYTPHPIQGHE
jgi:aryl-alcohol dehydrogenase-like predicted oxidoreductase